MNPISLLTKGRTIKALKERPGRYKLLCGVTVPKFGGTKSEIPTISHQAAPSEQAALFEKAKPVVEAKTEEVTKVEGKSSLAEKSPFARAALEKRKGLPTAQVEAAPAASTQPQPSSPEWFSRLAGKSAEWIGKWIPKRKTPKSRQETFQTELALEKVKVLRNDFSEDDLEVVLIEKNPGSGARKRVEKVELEELTARP